MSDLFDSIIPLNPPREVMAEGAMLLRGAALPFETDILTAIQAITAMSPFRHMVTPGGFVMSVAMTNCGAAGWVTEERLSVRCLGSAERKAVASDAGQLPRSRGRRSEGGGISGLRT